MLDENKDVALKELVETQDDDVPFVDVCFGLYLFVNRLHQALTQRKVENVFFFAREGQILKSMFDFYQAALGEENRIKTHYLKVSRRSTFLLSLGTLDEEDFSVLFRQYREISIRDFLKSLDLVDYAEVFAGELGVSAEYFSDVSRNLPTDGVFLRLLQLQGFREVYENQRLERSIAFSEYLKSFFEGGVLPDALHVVDVGWKGSIQDNVYHWLRKEKGNSAKVHGYYVGLISPGASNADNTKRGLLFSSVGDRTSGFHIFNENRSLYEILLHADHGSARKYELSESGEVIVVEDDFTEGAMIFENVRPVSLKVMDKFKQLVVAMQVSRPSDAEFLKLAMSRHGRMVFAPTSKEVDWIFSVSHVENFGVFEESRFGGQESPASLLKKLKFTCKLFLLRRSVPLGFWPWFTIQRNALPGMGAVYEFIRRWQSRPKSENWSR